MSHPRKNRYIFKATVTFGRRFYRLQHRQKESVQKKFKVFKLDPFHTSLGTHKIHVLSERFGHPIYSVIIERDLRVVFRVDGNIVTSLDVGSHSIYR